MHHGCRAGCWLCGGVIIQPDNNSDTRFRMIRRDCARTSASRKLFSSRSATNGSGRIDELYHGNKTIFGASVSLL